MISKKISKTQNIVAILIVFCIFLQLLRVQITQQFFFSFLLWNLFLATIPYIISEKLKTINITKNSKAIFICSLLVWLLFLPNAPYLVTDFIHLHHSKATMLWYDLFLLFCFANTGILLAIISLLNMYELTAKIWSKKTAKKCVNIAIILCGFGIYLGRFLRFNTWDVLTNPILLFKKSLLSLQKIEMWFITLGFATLLWMLFTLFRAFKEDKIKL